MRAARAFLALIVVLVALDAGARSPLLQLLRGSACAAELEDDLDDEVQPVCTPARAAPRGHDLRFAPARPVRGTPLAAPRARTPRSHARRSALVAIDPPRRL